MALTVQTLTDARDALVLALATGERRVRDSSGEEVEYRSVGEMQRALAHLESRIAAMSAGQINSVRFCTTKGT